MLSPLAFAALELTPLRRGVLIRMAMARLGLRCCTEDSSPDCSAVAATKNISMAQQRGIIKTAAARRVSMDRRAKFRRV
eukprot:scaffold118244_cov63-Phaeocystis_antarctica.AAC.2